MELFGRLQRPAKSRARRIGQAICLRGADAVSGGSFARRGERAGLRRYAVRRDAGTAPVCVGLPRVLSLAAIDPHGCHRYHPGAGGKGDEV